MALDKTPDMENLSPAERAKLYKQRAAAAGIGRPPSPSSEGAAAAGKPAPAPEAPAAKQAPEAAPREARAEQTPAADKQAPAAKPPAAAPKAAPAQKPPPEKPEKPAEPRFVQRLLAAVAEASWQWRHGYAEIKVPREQLLTAARLLRDSGFDYLSFVTEVDWRDRLEMLYHLFSYDYQEQPLGVVLRTDLPREDLPEVASLTAVWPGAEFMERECAEMMGIRFLGHPDLRKILLPEDFKGFPMRKDYEPDFEYVTVKKLVHELDPDFADARRGRSTR